eukprot:251506_1
MTLAQQKQFFVVNATKITDEITDVMAKLFLNTPPTTTLCALISLLTKYDASNFRSNRQFALKCSKAIIHHQRINKYDNVISDNLQLICVEIVRFFSANSIEIWSIIEQKNRFPFRTILSVISKLIEHCGDNLTTHLMSVEQKQLSTVRTILNLIYYLKANKSNDINIDIATCPA